MKKDYIRGFAEKCAEHGIKATDIVKEAAKAGVLSDFLKALQDAYSGSSLQGVIGDIGEGAGDAWNTVADSDVVGAMGDAGSAAGNKVVQLAAKLKEMIVGGGQ